MNTIKRFSLALMLLMPCNALMPESGEARRATDGPLRYGDILRLYTCEHDYVIGTKNTSTNWKNVAINAMTAGAGGAGLDMTSLGDASVSRSSKAWGSERNIRSLWKILGKDKKVGDPVLMGNEIQLLCLSPQFAGTTSYKIENDITEKDEHFVLADGKPILYGSAVNLKRTDPGKLHGKYLQTYKSKYQGMDWGGARDGSCRIIFMRNPVHTEAAYGAVEERAPSNNRLTSESFDKWSRDYQTFNGEVEWTTDATSNINIAFSNFPNARVPALRIALITDKKNMSQIDYGFNNSTNIPMYSADNLDTKPLKDFYVQGAISLKIKLSPENITLWAKKPTDDVSGYQEIFKTITPEQQKTINYILNLAFNNHTKSLPFFSFSKGANKTPVTISNVKVGRPDQGIMNETVSDHVQVAEW